MRLQDFMRYPDIACRQAASRPFEWEGRESPSAYKKWLPDLYLEFGIFNLAYQNVGMVIYLFMAEPPDHEISSYLAQISETCSVMGLAVVGMCSMLVMLRDRSYIESTLADLQQLYPVHGDQSQEHRIGHYYEQSARLMKYTFVFLNTASTYYNLLPIFDLLYDLSSESRQIRYKLQSNTWYPWQLLAGPDSIVSFMCSYLCQAQSAMIGVAFILSSMFMLCFFVTQIEMHFDALANRLGALDAGQPGANEALKSLISYHSRLLCVVTKVNAIFNFSFLVNFAASTVAICLMAFSMVMIDVASACKYSVGLLTFLLFLLFICHNGTKFTTASNKLLPAAFYNNWYDGDVVYRKMILFLMMRSSGSAVLRVYNYTPVSLVTYMAMVKFSFELFTFVTAMI